MSEPRNGSVEQPDTVALLWAIFGRSDEDRSQADSGRPDDAAVRDTLARLDGTEATAVSVATGLDHDELDDLGGVEA